MDNFETLAKRFAAMFETRTRVNGKAFGALKDGSPDWARGIVMQAHADMLPDDWRYHFIQEAAEWFAENGDDSDYFGAVDAAGSIYTSDLLDWLASNANRVAYVDEAENMYGHGREFDLVSAIVNGQHLEIEEVFGVVKTALHNCAIELEDVK